MRYGVANFLYRLGFPSGWISATDFRPHFDGHVLNVCTTISTGLEPERIETLLSRRLAQSFRWMRRIRFLLRGGDQIQYRLGSKRLPQQYLKAWSPRSGLASGRPPRDVAQYWQPGRTPLGR